MSNRKLVLCIFVLLAFLTSIDAYAGVTISDRRYWPNEARGSPGQAIEIYRPSFAYPETGIAEPRVAPQRKARRVR